VLHKHWHACMSCRLRDLPAVAFVSHGQAVVVLHQGLRPVGTKR
jgi:hypothetical protein